MRQKQAFKIRKVELFYYIVKPLLNKGANINAIGHGGKTALDSAKDNSHTEIVELLENDNP